MFYWPGSGWSRISLIFRNWSSIKIGNSLPDDIIVFFDFLVDIRSFLIKSPGPGETFINSLSISVNFFVFEIRLVDPLMFVF